MTRTSRRSTLGLGRHALVVEGSTEGALLSAVAEVLAEDTSVDYVHPDVAGLTLFDAQSDVAVPLYAPIFRSLGKRVYGVHDTPKAPISSELQAKASEFTHYRVIPYLGVEELLAAEIPMDVQRRFLAEVETSDEYPAHLGTVAATASDSEVRSHLRKVLEARKGGSWGYAAQLIGFCHGRSELPDTLVELLLDVDQDLRLSATGPPSPQQNGDPASGRAVGGA